MKAKGNSLCREGDGRVVLSTGWCKLHYRRWRANCHRLYEGLDRSTKDVCWSWHGNNYSDGRPCFYWWSIEDRKKIKMHAFRAALIVIRTGPYVKVQSHWEAAHRCHNPICVNPYHGFWATHLENVTKYIPEDDTDLYSAEILKEL